MWALFNSREWVIYWALRQSARLGCNAALDRYDCQYQKDEPYNKSLYEIVLFLEQ